MQLINIKIPNTHTHTHKPPKQFHRFLGLRHLLPEIKILHYRKDSIITY